MKLLAFTITLLAGSMAAQSSAPVPITIESATGKFNFKDWQKITLKPGQRTANVEITRNIDFTCDQEKGETRPRHLQVPSGTYAVDQVLRNKTTDRTLLLIPAASSRALTLGDNNSAGRTSNYQHYIPLDPETLAAYPKEVVTYVQGGSYMTGGGSWQHPTWTFICTPVSVSTGNTAVARILTNAEVIDARAAEKRAMEVEARARDAEIAAKRRAEEEQRAKQKVADRHRVSEIGSAVCKEGLTVLWKGYTEERSKDNGKIKVRIVGSRHIVDGRASNYVDPVPERTVWDAPSNWFLCEN